MGFFAPVGSCSNLADSLGVVGFTLAGGRHREQPWTDRVISLSDSEGLNDKLLDCRVSELLDRLECRSHFRKRIESNGHLNAVPESRSFLHLILREILLRKELQDAGCILDSSGAHDSGFGEVEQHVNSQVVNWAGDLEGLFQVEFFTREYDSGLLESLLLSQNTS
jgi:hypothetical protein